MKKTILFISLTTSIFASNFQDVIISENYIPQKECKIIKKLEVKDSDNSTKEDLYNILKRKANNINANSVLNTTYHTSLFGNYITGDASKCNLEKTTSLKAKVTNTKNKFSKHMYKKDIGYYVKSTKDIHSFVDLFYVGYGYSRVKGSYTKNTYNTQISKSITTKIDYRYDVAPVKIGLQIDQSRLELIYLKVNIDQTHNKKYRLNYNYLFYKYPKNFGLVPYATIGYGINTLEDNNNITKSKSLNTGLGLLVNLHKYLEIDFSVKYEYTNNNNSKTSGENISQTNEENTIGYAGVNLKF